MSIKVEGEAEFKRNMDRLAKNFGREIAEAAVAGGQMVRTTAIKSIQSQSPGRTVVRYTEGGNPVQHIASNPGEPPNTDTGRLVGSIQVDVEAKDVFVGSTLEYAGALEFGTSIMQPRPWLNPALEKNRNKIRKLFRDATFQVIRKG